MSEILIQRIISREKLFEQLRFAEDDEKVIYTNDEGFLTQMYDVRTFLHEDQLKNHVIQIPP